MSCKVTRHLDYVLDEFQCGMTSMFFRQGKTRCGREEYVHLKSYRMSRFRIHLSHTHTHTTKANSLHVTSQSDKMGRIAPKRQQMDRGRWHTNTHTCSRWKQYPKKASQFDKVDDRRKKKHAKREGTVFQHACMGKYCSGTWKYRLIQVCDAFFSL